MMQFASSGIWHVFYYCFSYFYIPTTFVFRLDNIYVHWEQQTQWALVTDDTIHIIWCWYVVIFLFSSFCDECEKEQQQQT